jgi:hypothetical protein
MRAQDTFYLIAAVFGFILTHTSLSWPIKIAFILANSTLLWVYASILNYLEELEFMQRQHYGLGKVDRK